MSGDSLERALIEANAVLFGEFELSNGGTSEYYVDKYQFETQPDVLSIIANRFADEVDADRLGGVALGGVPLVAATSIETGKPYAIARKAAKEYGTGNRVEGDVGEEEVAVIEDIATTGQSALEAANALRGAGADVRDVYVVVDRQEGASELLEENGLGLHALTTAEELLEEADSTRE